MEAIHMSRNTMCLVAALAVLGAACFAQDEEQPTKSQLVLGPRIGCSYIIESAADFTESIRELYPTGDYFPVVTVFGVTLEQRILLGQTRSHFAFQGLVLILGLEQGIAIPEGALLIGYRDFSGFELGIGPLVSPAGISVLAALGWTFSYHGVYVPVDLSLIIPNASRPPAIGLTTGFNFNISRRQ
jgi:hypothetical protein